MADLDISGFQQLYDTLRGIDLVGTGPPAPPWGDGAPTADDVRAAITPAAVKLPLAYRDAYVRPLLDQLDVVVQQADPVTLETLAGAVFDHDVADVDPQLDQFLAVVSNLYRSFLSARKRAGADIPLTEQLPPLAMFLHTGGNGPFTIPADDVQRTIGSPVGVVSLPSVYRDQPLLWASLAHETGGHDVLHADPDLLPELREGVQKLFPGAPTSTGGQVTLQRLLGMLWAYWMDEAASDIYGVLNIGPTFGLNLAAFFAALNATFQPSPRPALRTSSGHPPDSLDLDPHPTDILRLDLIRGAVEVLTGLSQESRNAYTAALDALSAACGGTAEFVTLQGVVRTDNGSGVRLNNRFSMATMKSAARTVGAFIATTRLAALDGHSIQDIETWDDPDEVAAQAVRVGLLGGQPVADAGDDAQLLAGATLAAFEKPGDYAAISTALADALTASFARDPIWSVPSPDAVRLEAVVVDFEEFGPSLDVVGE